MTSSIQVPATPMKGRPEIQATFWPGPKSQTLQTFGDLGTLISDLNCNVQHLKFSKKQRLKSKNKT